MSDKIRIYCGIKETPKGAKSGNMKECAEEGKIMKYGLQKIDPKTLEHAKKQKDVEKVKAKLRALNPAIKKLVEEAQKLYKIEQKRANPDKAKIKALEVEFKALVALYNKVAPYLKENVTNIPLSYKQVKAEIKKIKSGKQKLVKEKKKVAKEKAKEVKKKAKEEPKEESESENEDEEPKTKEELIIDQIDDAYGNKNVNAKNIYDKLSDSQRNAIYKLMETLFKHRRANDWSKAQESTQEVKIYNKIKSFIPKQTESKEKPKEKPKEVLKQKSIVKKKISKEEFKNMMNKLIKSDKPKDISETFIKNMIITFIEQTLNIEEDEAIKYYMKFTKEKLKELHKDISLLVHHNDEGDWDQKEISDYIKKIHAKIRAFIPKSTKSKLKGKGFIDDIINEIDSLITKILEYKDAGKRYYVQFSNIYDNLEDENEKQRIQAEYMKQIAIREQLLRKIIDENYLSLKQIVYDIHGQTYNDKIPFDLYLSVLGKEKKKLEKEKASQSKTSESSYMKNLKSEQKEYEDYQKKQGKGLNNDIGGELPWYSHSEHLHGGNIKTAINDVRRDLPMAGANAQCNLPLFELERIKHMRNYGH